MIKNTKKTVLIVEDDEILLRVLYLSFHKGEYTIASASDGETALKMTERLKPDIVLLDLLLPKMNGFDYLRSIKANPELKNIPVIVLSNLGDKDSVEKAKALGAEDYFVKSDTNLSVLFDKVKKKLES
ncbi:MAG: response regulator [Patescibacteria group bacterium]|jgi:CheY-like chemotaxis protein|nr:response regulator [Patescibacteria group bacterium]